MAKNLVNLFEEGNTIPFIARYRRNLVNNMSPEDLRDVKDVYDKINALKDKCNSIIKSLEKNGHLNETIKNTILSSKSIEEIEHIVCIFMRIGMLSLLSKFLVCSFQTRKQKNISRKG